ncbi:hypothetical protein GCM10009717_02000 [Agromyces allii]|uniref:Uncharacterized protein n=1 Tax=Agromyces allii TaxID=393607 RepID=A0ABN2Q0B1_9MICO
MPAVAPASRRLSDVSTIEASLSVFSGERMSQGGWCPYASGSPWRAARAIPAGPEAGPAGDHPSAVTGIWSMSVNDWFSPAMTHTNA